MLKLQFPKYQPTYITYSISLVDFNFVFAKHSASIETKYIYMGKIKIKLDNLATEFNLNKIVLLMKLFLSRIFSLNYSDRRILLIPLKLQSFKINLEINKNNVLSIGSVKN